MTHSLKPSDLAAIETATLQIGREIFESLTSHRPHVLQRQWWDDRIMDWAMREESVKVQMFRFVDVLPMLKTAQQITGHLHEYFDEVHEHLPKAIRLAMAVAKPNSVMGRALAMAAKRNARGSAKRFIAGTNAKEVLRAAKKQRQLSRAFTLDVLGEAVTSDVEADHYAHKYEQLIRNVAPEVNRWQEIPLIDCNSNGPIPRANVSVKLSALDSQFDPIDPLGTTRRVLSRLRPILRTAREHHTFVNIDMESYHTKDLTFAIFKQVMTEDEFRDCADIGIVVQCYLRDSLHDLLSLRDWAKKRGTPVWVRLVKGAYWDYETTHYGCEGWPIPVYQQKWKSDANFERAAQVLISNHEYLRPALGSHNVRSLAYGIAVAEHLKVPTDRLEIQMLYGMGDPEKAALVNRGHRLRIYMPYGELIPGMAYLVRRLLENTSNDSFLRASFTEHHAIDELLSAPLITGNPNSNTEPLPTEEIDSMDHSANNINKNSEDNRSPYIQTFENEPLSDFAKEANRRKMQQALDDVKGKLGQTYPLVIGNEQFETAERITSINPSHKDEVIGTVMSAGEQEVQRAVETAKEALRQWAMTDVSVRADWLRKVAELMRRCRFELAAWMVYECGKPWREADGDVAEAIDFCDYYAAGVLEMYRPSGVDMPGEENRFEYLPRGVVAVISPWNFPLAIVTGMTVAALATGNTVIMKPAEQSSVIAAKLMEIFQAAELPAGVVNFLPGDGEVTGAKLVDHPDVALIAFTGSRQVGLAINARAAEISTKAGTNMKQVIAEMGGKNAVIVDDDADLDEAVLGVVQSAFGFQGQKCSACSRCIVLDSVYDTFLDRLVEATRSLTVGPANDPGTKVGPVIDEEAFAKMKKYIEIAKTEGREMLAVEVGELIDQGYFIGPHIFADIAPGARLAQEEIFGPILAVIRATDIDQAIQIANDTDYALTGGIFSRSPATLKKIRRELMVGNIYLNRSITGAIVSRQPFGGFKMSGIGSKAGGPNYLYQFTVPRTITENTMRRGYAPNSE